MKLLGLALSIALIGCAMDIQEPAAINEGEKTARLALVCDAWGLVLEEEYQDMYFITWQEFGRDGENAYIYYSVVLKDPDGPRYTLAGDTWVVFNWARDKWTLESSQRL